MIRPAFVVFVRLTKKCVGDSISMTLKNDYDPELKRAAKRLGEKYAIDVDEILPLLHDVYYVGIEDWEEFVEKCIVAALSKARSISYVVNAALIFHRAKENHEIRRWVENGGSFTDILNDIKGNICR